MADQDNAQTPPAGNGNGGGAAQQTTPRSDARVIINTHYIKDLSFENPNAPAVFAHKEGHQISVNIDVRAAHLQDQLYEVLLSIKATTTVADTTAFLIELDFASLCTVNASVPDAERHDLLSVEVPRYLFPFARNIIADVSRDGGYPPLLINPVDFAHLRQQGGQPPQAEATA